MEPIEELVHTLFTSLTEEEIMANWRSVKHTRVMSDDKAWQTFVTCMVLGLAFNKTRKIEETVQ